MKRTIIIACDKCDSTGLKLIDERKGIAIICPDCKGTGWHNFTYSEFTGIKPLSGVKQILGR